MGIVSDIISNVEDEMSLHSAGSISFNVVSILDLKSNLAFSLVTKAL